MLVDKPSVETIDQRLDSMDKAISLLQGLADRMPTPALVQADVDALKELTDTKINALKELVDAKFEGNKTALDAALKTQKEASDKIEANFSKQFEGITSISQATTKASDDKISDIKDRITAIESRKQGMSDGWGYLVGGIGLLISVALFAATVIGKQI